MGIGGWELDDAEFTRYYGPWRECTPHDAAVLLQGYPGPWWIAGGWAIEAFTGVPREHDDLDLSTLHADLAALRDHLRGRYQMWSCLSGMQRPVFESLPGGDERELIEGSRQIWLRRSAGAPWEYDVLLVPGDDDTWVYRRDPSIRLPLRDALWTKDGIAYLRPELQLLYKAAGLRPKDRADFAACLPLLDRVARDRLRDGLVRTIGAHHPWVGPLDAAD